MKSLLLNNYSYTCKDAHFSVHQWNKETAVFAQIQRLNTRFLYVWHPLEISYLLTERVGHPSWTEKDHKALERRPLHTDSASLHFLYCSRPFCIRSLCQLHPCVSAMLIYSLSWDFNSSVLEPNGHMLEPRISLVHEHFITSLKTFCHLFVTALKLSHICDPEPFLLCFNAVNWISRWCMNATEHYSVLLNLQSHVGRKMTNRHENEVWICCI